tara:strand:+ start:1247 stop:1585 length:339 start_codon:yes stop_codon:yes gene_type:complete
MQTTGKHVTADIWLNEYIMGAAEIAEMVRNALAHSKMTVLGSSVHDFGSGAFTGVWLLAESHFSIHTFPERNYISLDCYTCGNEGDPLACLSHFAKGLDVADIKMRVMQRGV